MQPWQVRKRLARLEQWTNRAAGLCGQSGDIRPEVRAEVTQLDDRVELTAQALQGESDLTRMAEQVAALERQGERVEQLAAEASSADIASPLRKAHKELVRLKRQLPG